jgi:hypothetical protein
MNPRQETVDTYRMSQRRAPITTSETLPCALSRSSDAFRESGIKLDFEDALSPELLIIPY